MKSVEYNGFVYHVGDKVMMDDPYWEEGYPPNGSIGEIKAIEGKNIAVDWEPAFRLGHHCDGLVSGKHGRYYRFDEVVDKSCHEHVSLLIPLQTESQAEIEESDDLLAFIHGFAL